MKVRQSKSRRFLAVVLSASFIWAAMACVSLCLLHGSEADSCATESAETSSEATAFAGQSVQAGQLIYTNADSCCEPDCCPVKPLPVCALQKSSAIDFQAHGDYQVSCIGGALAAAARRLSHRQDWLPHSTSDPPLTRLCTLRI
jgi:hypothetical protein